MITWIATIIIGGSLVGLIILEKEDGEWSVFFKGLKILLTSSAIVMATLRLLYAGFSELTSMGAGVGLGIIIYVVDLYISKKMKVNEQK